MNESAFPWSVDDGKKIVGNKGMTMRDYFAAKAMPVALKTLMHDYTRDDEDWFWESYIDNDMLAELSYEMADSMLKAREK